MQMLPDIHISGSTQVFPIFPWGKINKLLTYKSVAFKYPTSLLEHSNYSGVNKNFFIQINTNSEI